MSDRRSQIRDHLTARLAAKGDTAPFADGDSLFVAGRLDSLDAVETVVFLETFGIDFAALGFDLSLIDSVDAIASLLPQ